MDFDEKGHTDEIVARLLGVEVASLTGSEVKIPENLITIKPHNLTVLLIEESVRRGTHVLVELPAGMSADEAQQLMKEATGFEPDVKVKGYDRCIYMVPESHTRYVSERLFEQTLPQPLPKREGSDYSQDDETASSANEHTTPLHTGRGRGEGLLLGRVYLLASNRLPLESFAYLPDRESVSQEPFDSLLNRVKAIKMADSIAVVIVNLHWGAEHTLLPLPQQRLEAHALIEAGADVIIGHHTHTLQTTETYRGKPIFYSIGNFIFDQQRPLNTRACIVRLRITPEKTMADAIPVRIDHCAPRLGR